MLFQDIYIFPSSLLVPFQGGSNVFCESDSVSKCESKVLPSKYDWFPSTIEAFWEKSGRLWIFNHFGILRESA